MSGDNSFGRWLSARRHLLDLTQDELARQAGCAVVTIRKLEADERRPSRQLAERLAHCLALPLAERAAFVRLARRDPLAPGVPESPFPMLTSDRPFDAPRLTTVPAPLTDLLGRDAELAALSIRLTDRRVRLLTLIGPPGIGKTRLAISAATSVSAAFADGVAFVDLSSISAPQLVLPTIAKVLGVQEQGDQAVSVLLRAHLRSRQMLLVLDNFEQVVDAAPALADLLAACASVSALVTSRTALQVRGEYLHPVPPLPVPDLTAMPPTAMLELVPSVALFAERARAVVPTFALTELNAPAVSAICARLDGLPLAIELIAARVAILPPAALLTRLTSRLDLLTHGGRDLPPRQRTLRSAIAWSYDLLTTHEQVLFRRLGVFVGGCTIEAVEHVCVLPDELLGPRHAAVGGPAESGVPSANVLALVSALVHHSLLRQEVTADGEVRLSMLATLQEYACEQLDAAGDHATIAQRHADYYRQLAAQGEAGIRGPGQLRWLDRLSREHGNVRSALDWYHAQPDGAPQELELVASLWTFFVMRCHYAEGRAAIDRALARRDADSSVSRASALALVGAGFLAGFQGHITEALRFGEESAAAWRQLGDKWGLALALNIVGGAHDDSGAEQLGVAALEESLALARGVGEPWCLGLALNNLAVTRVVQRDEARARALLEAFLALGQRAQIPYFIANATGNLGGWDWARGDYDAAIERLEVSAAIYQQLGDRVQAARIISALGDIAREHGAYAAAARHYAASLAVLEEVGEEQRSCYVRCRLGYLALAAQAQAQAATHFRTSLERSTVGQYRQCTTLCLFGIAVLAGERGAWERAVVLLSSAAASHSRSGEQLGHSDVRLQEQLLNTARTHVSAEAFDTSWRAGQELDEEEAVRLALEESSVNWTTAI